MDETFKIKSFTPWMLDDWFHLLDSILASFACMPSIIDPFIEECKFSCFVLFLPLKKPFVVNRGQYCGFLLYAERLCYDQCLLLFFSIYTVSSSTTVVSCSNLLAKAKCGLGNKAPWLWLFVEVVVDWKKLTLKNTINIYVNVSRLLKVL